MGKKPALTIFFICIAAILVAAASFYIGFVYSSLIAKTNNDSSTSTTVAQSESSTTTLSTSTTIAADKMINNFEDCAEAGYPIAESYPEQCRTPDGRTFVQNIGNELEKTDLITISSPRPNQEVSSPIKIEGQARGNWFFEASFPIKLEHLNGTVIASGIATAQGEWMTEDFVPYTAELKFNVTEPTSATMILQKDNPSGLPEHDDKLILPVKLIP